ncbi:uncharacterized protein BDR25DRAFT_300288 [Lindgomyces ingoldianus]|uniref:Uncharacterized protein n=1 Tax=Lindgomyces ingoldianus TaxID=673940 RepID=A0ACB6REZ2_9PLEO|nr:uncharacterized protein BDR25DRAFT_300288 [Lindgomyces ingoldianus]KAF2477323.1 hypothetical protein BDR25DRAFT_300288 [Lindgomyces ingoldianus]
MLSPAQSSLVSHVLVASLPCALSQRPPSIGFSSHHPDLRFVTPSVLLQPQHATNHISASRTSFTPTMVHQRRAEFEDFDEPQRTALLYEAGVAVRPPKDVIPRNVSVVTVEDP